MRDVYIFQYYVFANVAVNLPNGTLDFISISGSQGIEKIAQYKNEYSIDSGVLLIYQDSPKTFKTNLNKLIITHSTFS